MSGEALARTAAMNARLVPQPEPVRPEWVRLTAPGSAIGHQGDVVKVVRWGHIVGQSAPTAWVNVNGYDQFLWPSEWEPADAPVDDPPQPTERDDAPPAEADGASGSRCNLRLPSVAEPAAETWKEGDWFTVPDHVTCDTMDVRPDEPYRVVKVGMVDWPRVAEAVHCIDDANDLHAFYCDEVTRCDPPVVDEPAPTWKAGDRVHRIHHGDGIVAEVRPLRGDYCVAVAFMRYQNQRLLWFRPEELTAAAAPDPEMVAVTLPRQDAEYYAADRAPSGDPWGQSSYRGRLAAACAAALTITETTP